MFGANKEVIVVFPEQYRDLGRVAAHMIAKRPGWSAAAWSVNNYVTNEISHAASRLTLLIGNAEENSVSKDFLPIISNVKDLEGACYGYDGPRAIVFTNETSMVNAQHEKLLIELEKISKEIEEWRAEEERKEREKPKPSLLEYVADKALTTALTPFALALMAYDGVADTARDISCWWTSPGAKKIRLEELHTTTQKALEHFLEEGFNVWVGPPKQVI